MTGEIEMAARKKTQPEKCDHSLENGKKIEDVSDKVDCLATQVNTIKDNHLKHMSDDITHLKEESKETKEKLHELKEDQVEMKTDIKHIIKGADRNFKWIFWLMTSLGAGAVGVIFAVAKGFI